MRYVSWLFLCVVLIGGLSPLTAAPADGGPVSLHSIDVGMSNDIPLGALRDKTGYNPGLAAQVNFEVSQYPWLRVAAGLGNAYWLAIPEWIDFGTRVDALVGIGVQFPVTGLGALGDLVLGAQAMYGGMVHLVTADTTGTGATGFFFVDQLAGLALEAELLLAGGNFGIYLRPRFLIAPEQTDVKLLPGVVAGVRWYPGTGMSASGEAR